MVTTQEIFEIASRLPGTVVSADRLGLAVPVKGKLKGYAWTWMERVQLKKPKVENPRVLAVVVRNLEIKDMFLATDPAKYFTEAHYNNFAAILVRLDAVDVADLEDLLTEAWRARAPKELLALAPE